ncbi:MAG: hypothetical protein ACXVFN_17100 [Solirubrobacteraceae bacterium]
MAAASRAAGHRLIAAAAAAVLLAVAVAAAAVLRADGAPGIWLASTVGAGLVAASMWRRRPTVLWAGVLVLAAADVTALVIRDLALDPTVALDGAALFLAAELAAARIEASLQLTEFASAQRWLLTRSALAAVGATAGLLVVAVAGMAPERHVALTVVAATAPVALLALAVRLTRRG